MSEETASEGDPSSSVQIERRAWVRYAADMQASCHVIGAMHDAGWPGMVQDISSTGIALLLRHRFKPGSSLLVELKSVNGKFLRTVRAQVLHVRPAQLHGEHGWRVGCALLGELSDDELQGLL